tara:strand:- start:1993 stop:3168 length:1176 start_codon:yes stop_codon:yes gene_type:complete
MAVTNFEALDTSADVTTTKTLLYESIPLTGAISSGTYSDNNIKNYSHAQFQSVYDYPYLSSSANHIFDVTMGYDEGSDLSGAAAVQNSKKINMYNQMSQVLLGYTGSDNTVRKFELDLAMDEIGECKAGWFINLSRLITKDQIKKGSFSIELGTASYDAANAFSNPFADRGTGDNATVTLTDASASDTGGTTNTFGGDYGILFSNRTGSWAATGQTGSAFTSKEAVGVIFYQAGVVFLSTASFTGSLRQTTHPSQAPQGDTPRAPINFHYYRDKNHYQTIAQTMTGSNITGSCDELRRRIKNISFNNTTEINSTIYFCRVPHNKYNHSSNPTYLSSSQIRVKSLSTDTPIAYITTIGLYNSSNQLLATAKLSEPLRKDPSNEITLRVRLDY